jgi:hypothetical protein
MTWRVGKNVPINVYGDEDRPVCQCHTALDARRIVDAVNDRDADDRDWQQIAEVLGIPALSATREQIVEQCRKLKNEGGSNGSD